MRNRNELGVGGLGDKIVLEKNPCERKYFPIHHLRVAVVNLYPVSHPNKAAVAPVTNHNSAPPQGGTNRSHHIQPDSGKWGTVCHRIQFYYSTPHPLSPLSVVSLSGKCATGSISDPIESLKIAARMTVFVTITRVAQNTAE